MSTGKGTVIIVPGIGALPGRHWYPSLKAALENCGFTVEILCMRFRWLPFSALWASDIKSAVARHVENGPIYLVGHSIAGPAILRYVADNKPGCITGVMLVAPVAVSVYALNVFEVPFWPIKPERVVGKVERWGVVCSADDPVVPPRNALWYATNLGANYRQLAGYRHFCDDDRRAVVTELPDEALKSLSWVIGLPTENLGG